ncbi:MAG: PilZ domain-containing protein [Nitrospinota bacterium]|nr:MAG: PilZ domain-containing protein [Nitrospinota bacterium]
MDAVGERRHAPRKGVTLRVDYVDEGGRANIGMARNLSPGGLFLEPSTTLSPGETLALAFSLPTGEPVKGKARVVHRQNGGVGLCFVALDQTPDESLHRLQAVCSVPSSQEKPPARPGIEARRHARKPVAFRVDCACVYGGRRGGYVATGLATNLSPEGIFVRYAQELPLGEIVTTTFVLPSGEPLRLRARVVHHGKGEGAGLHFVDIKENPDAARLLLTCCQ